jgi:hypothetical protein
MYTLEIYKADRRVKSGERFVGKYDYDRPDKDAMVREIRALYPTYKSLDGYRFEIHETYVTRKNLMGGAEYQERYDTPRHCSPASEAYWTM